MSGFRKRVKGMGGISHTPTHTKSLGPKLGRSTQSGSVSTIDGDGDGFVSGPDGRDDIPAPVVAAGKEVMKLWDAVRAAQLDADEKRAIKAKEAAKKKPPAHSLAEVAQKLTRAQRREEVIEARQMAYAFAKSLFEVDGLGDDGSYRARLLPPKGHFFIKGDTFKDADEMHPELHLLVEGEIVDKDGKRVGLFSRSVYLDSENRNAQPYIYHDFFKILSEDNRGKGIGADFTLATEARYETLGISEIHLNAALHDGTYTWSRAGYKLKSKRARDLFVADIRERIEKMTGEAGGVDKLIAGGFKSSIGILRKDGPRDIPKDLLGSREEFDTFMKLVDAIEAGDAEPAVLTAFPKFARNIMFGMITDMKKPVGIRNRSKALYLYGLDKIFNIV